MIPIRLMRQSNLDDLKANIESNIQAYASSDPSQFPDPEMVSFEVDMEADLNSLSKLKLSNSHKDEVFNCLLVFEALKNVKPELARDERLWTFLTHYHALEYSSKRWPVKNSDENKENYIRSHYFAQTKRGIERDNAISRLWWMAFIANKAESGTLEENLDALLQFTDVRANIIERPSTGRSNKVLTAVLEKLREAHKIFKKSGNKGLFERSKFRQLMSALNAIGGYVMLDALAQKQLSQILTELVSTDGKEGKEYGKVSLGNLIKSALYSKK